MRIFVGNLPYQATESELTDLFAQFGTVVSAKIVKDVNTGASKGFGFIEMSTKEEGESAIRELNGKSLRNRVLNVSVARPREDRKDLSKPRQGRNPSQRTKRRFE